MSDRFEDREALAAKVSWEGGILEALDYGITTEMMPEGDTELTEAWAKLEASFRETSRLADAVEKLIEDRPVSTTEQAGRTIVRYTVPVDDHAWTFDLTSDPVAVGNGITLDEVDFWAEYADGEPKKPRRFQVFGTGHQLPQNARHVGTCPRVSGLICHLYELVSDEETAP